MRATGQVLGVGPAGVAAGVAAAAGAATAGAACLVSDCWGSGAAGAAAAAMDPVGVGLGCCDVATGVCAVAPGTGTASGGESTAAGDAGGASTSEASRAGLTAPPAPGAVYVLSVSSLVDASMPGAVTLLTFKEVLLSGTISGSVPLLAGEEPSATVAGIPPLSPEATSAAAGVGELSLVPKGAPLVVVVGGEVAWKLCALEEAEGARGGLAGAPEVPAGVPGDPALVAVVPAPAVTGSKPDLGAATGGLVGPASGLAPA
jgi:hypothetical protein